MFHQLAAFVQKVKANISMEVPADMAACEFNCRELDCTAQSWEDCPKRRQKAEAIQHLHEHE